MASQHHDRSAGQPIDVEEIRFSIESDVDFDTVKALMMTVTGVCAAFVAIGALMLLSVVSMRFSRWWSGRTQPPSASPQASGAAPGAADEAAPDSDAQTAAAIGAAVALAMDGGPKAAPEVDQGAGGPGIRGWRSVGRWPQIHPGSAWRRPEGGRGRQRS